MSFKNIKLLVTFAITNRLPLMSTTNSAPDTAVDALADEFDLMSLSKEARIQRALEAIAHHAERGEEYSIRRAATDYVVPRSTLNDRYNGLRTRAEAHAHQQSLTPSQETILVEWIKAQVGSLSFPLLVHC